MRTTRKKILSHIIVQRKRNKLFYAHQWRLSTYGRFHRPTVVGGVSLVIHGSDFSNLWMQLIWFGFGYLVGKAPKLGHRTDGLWCVNNLPKVVTWECSGYGHWVWHGKVYFAECGIFVRCILRNENLRKMMLLLLLSFLIVFVRRLNIVS